MTDKELLNTWKSYDQKLEEVLSLNKKIVRDMTKNKLNDTIGSLRRPKQIALLLGIPYTLFLYLITFIAFNAGGFFITIGFGSISIIMTAVISTYFFHLYLIQQISHSQDIIDVQTKIAKLKISSFKNLKLVVIQLPFWSICWISLEVLKSSPVLYGGVNLLIFLGLSYTAYWIYTRLNIHDTNSKVSRFFLSGNEWEPILKASNILEQLKEYEN